MSIQGNLSKATAQVIGATIAKGVKGSTGDAPTPTPTPKTPTPSPQEGPDLTALGLVQKDGQWINPNATTSGRLTYPGMGKNTTDIQMASQALARAQAQASFTKAQKNAYRHYIGKRKVKK